MVRGVLGLLVLWMVLTGCRPKETVNESVAVKPNFLFILVDDMGWKDLGCYGSSFYETPAIDQLASEGMQFMEAYAACPVCSPTRASIMTGKYPARMNTTDWFGAPQPENAHKHHTGKKPLLPASYEEQMALEETTLAEALKESGYKTFFAGKWHLGGKGYYPEDQGFDLNSGGFEKGSPPSYFSPFKNPKLSDGPDGEHLPARLAKETIQFIEQHKEQPFLAYLSFYSVHTPLRSREDLTTKYDQKKAGHEIAEDALWGQEGERKVRLIQEHSVYAGMVEAMDQAVGDVLSKLKDLGLGENTVVVFTSDNGGLSTSEGHPTSNLPLRAGKGWLYEGGIREPLIIKWPGVITVNSRSNVPITSTDYFPTFLEMAAVDTQQLIDGISLVKLLKGEEPETRPIFWHYPHYGNQGGSPGSAVRYGDYKLIRFYEDNTEELYNLKEDIGEKHN